jgi:hypothetical protein
MATETDDKLLDDLLDERVHLLIRINLVENRPSDPFGVAPLLKRRLRGIEEQIDAARHALEAGWRSHALVKED